MKVPCVRSVIKSLSGNYLILQKKVARLTQHSQTANSQAYLTRISAVLDQFAMFAAIKCFFERSFRSWVMLKNDIYCPVRCHCLVKSIFQPHASRGEWIAPWRTFKLV